MKRTCLHALAALAIVGIAATPAAQAQTVLTGHHDGSTTSNGYSAAGGTYLVLADTGGTLDATFNNNYRFGLTTSGSSTFVISGGQFSNNGSSGFRNVFGGSTIVSAGQFNNNGGNGVSTSNDVVVVTGGQFNSNGFYGLVADKGSNVTVSGGQFNSNSYGLVITDSGIAVSGGQFIDNSYGLVITNSTATVTGGQFNNTVFDFYANPNGTTQSAINIYGQFDGLTVGQTQTLPSNAVNGINGLFTGTLKNETASRTYSYRNFGTITLYDVAPAPEPSPIAALTIGLLGLGALALKARKRIA